MHGARCHASRGVSMFAAQSSFTALADARQHSGRRHCRLTMDTYPLCVLNGSFTGSFSRHLLHPRHDPPSWLRRTAQGSADQVVQHRPVFRLFFVRARDRALGRCHQSQRAATPSASSVRLRLAQQGLLLHCGLDRALGLGLDLAAPEPGARRVQSRRPRLPRPLHRSSWPALARLLSAFSIESVSERAVPDGACNRGYNWGLWKSSSVLGPRDELTAEYPRIATRGRSRARSARVQRSIKCRFYKLPRRSRSQSGDSKALFYDSQASRGGEYLGGVGVGFVPLVRLLFRRLRASLLIWTTGTCTAVNANNNNNAVRLLRVCTSCFIWF